MHLSSGDLWHSSGNLRQPLASSCAAARSSAELYFGSQWVPMVMSSQVTHFGGIWGRFPVLANLARGCRSWRKSHTDPCKSHNCVCIRSVATNQDLQVLVCAIAVTDTRLVMRLLVIANHEMSRSGTLWHDFQKAV